MASSGNVVNRDTMTSSPESTSPKDKVSSDEKQEVIYSVRCKCCDGEYVGETKRNLSTRMKEHRISVSKGNEKSVLSTHNLRTSHTFDWDHVDMQPTRDQHKVTEAIHIRLRNEAII